ncbi:nuclease [Prochlorococcus sp. MIT 1223]|uniref:nuclease n=1 Tax=Prochlorococcus sp. MIT 1223 TaxID=3096217 RepID=UPI002A753EF3|nr:nuclease [Prochlorococcus sp. MIT 1223]
MKLLIPFLILISSLILVPLNLIAAEVLNISNSTTLLIGDHNRNYTVQIACLAVDPSQEKTVIGFLEASLPRHSKINLKPKGSDDGVLISNIIKIGPDLDIAEEIVSRGLASSTC